jgi:hypothetical protein
MLGGIIWELSWQSSENTYLLGTRVNNGKRCTEVDAKTGY